LIQGFLAFLQNLLKWFAPFATGTTERTDSLSGLNGRGMEEGREEKYVMKKN